MQQLIGNKQVLFITVLREFGLLEVDHYNVIFYLQQLNVWNFKMNQSSCFKVHSGLTSLP